MQGDQLINKDMEQPCDEDRHTYPDFFYTFIHAYTHRNTQQYAERFAYAYKETLYG